MNILFLALFSISLPAYAIHGNHLPASENPPQVCKLSIQLDTITDGRRLICSATLLTPSGLVTAAHCLDPKEWKANKILSIDVACDGLEPIPAVLTVDNEISRGIITELQKTEPFKGLAGTRFYEGWDLAEDGSRAMLVPNDVGFVALSKPIPQDKIPTMAMRRVFDTKEELEANFAKYPNLPRESAMLTRDYFNLIERGECRISGFGISSEDPNSIGKAHYTAEAPYPRYVYSSKWVSKIAESSHILIGEPAIEATVQRYRIPKNQSPIGKNLENKFDHGDSGGSFYCRTSPTSDWILVGIISQLSDKTETKVQGFSQFITPPQYLPNWKFLVNSANAWNRYMKATYKP